MLKDMVEHLGVGWTIVLGLLVSVAIALGIIESLWLWMIRSLKLAPVVQMDSE